MARPAAHTPREPGGEWHDLAAHLQSTAELARERAQKFDADDLAYAAGIALYKKFGFEVEGTHRRLAFRDGEYIDAYSMARLKP